MRLPLICQLAADPFDPPTFKPDYSHPLVSIPLAVASFALLNWCATDSAITEKCSSPRETASIASCRARLYDRSKGAIAISQMTCLAIGALGLTVAFVPSMIANVMYRNTRSANV